ncbi:hypothetical protein FOMPIDRAFT_93823 [Fomitopsis schrenkii]|uniref:Uncharacterized protein n=1 Tax=Fomitopsis schrenkii TaxID=2126942 RepID=S8DSH9_FOMSC|nr:hypothetical protein FOMPIDRAFT_93823 [Fomitopsis schrenkii]
MTNFSKGVPLPYAIALKDDSNPIHFMRVYERCYAFIEGRDVGILNCSTTPKDIYRLTPTRHPLIWFDIESDNFDFMTKAGMLNDLLEADTPIVRRTGEMRTLHAADGSKRMELEVEILMDEGEFAATYCAYLERVEYCRYERCGGDATHPL